MKKTERFARAYYVAGTIAILLFLPIVGTINQYWNLNLSLIIAWMIPLFSGGVLLRFRMSLVVTLLYFMFVSHRCYEVFQWSYKVTNQDDPNSSGSTLAVALMVYIFYIFTFVPWAFALLRGLVALPENKSKSKS